MRSDEIRLVDEAWKYPLFEAFARRRGHRFLRNGNLQDAQFPFKSQERAVPLSELETALLAWAGHGVNGLAMCDVGTSYNTFMSWLGRTHPSPCNDQHGYLFFVNDSGVFMYNPVSAGKPVEIETPEDRGMILDSFRKDTVQVMDCRPYFPPGAMLKLNVWNANQPGQTLFLPVVDITYEYINFLLLGFCDDGYRIIDERTGKPAGIAKWCDNGFLNGPQMTISMMEVFVYSVVAGTAHYMAQNINLAAMALGTGCYVWAGFTPLVIMGGTPLTAGLGFRFVTGKDGMPTPVGKDGLIQALCPPYYRNMDEAVDHVLELKFGKEGLFAEKQAGPSVYQDRSMYTKVRKYPEEGIACIKAYANYVYDNFGRFPAYVDALQMPVAATAHHLDLAFYDKYYETETVTQQQREHMHVWHE
jgi:hypothetical protein